MLREALRQLPGHRQGVRPGRKILIRSDAAGCTHELLDWLVGQRLSYSVGFTLPDTITDELTKIGERDWQVAYDADGEPRPGAWVCEVTGLLDLARWPAGMRVIVRKERPHPGAQLRITDADGHRYTAFATNTPRAARVVSSPTSNCATAAGPVRRTASAAPRTPGCEICRCTT